MLNNDFKNNIDKTIQWFGENKHPSYLTKSFVHLMEVINILADQGGELSEIIRILLMGDTKDKSTLVLIREKLEKHNNIVKQLIGMHIFKIDPDIQKIILEIEENHGTI